MSENEGQAPIEVMRSEAERRLETGEIDRLLASSAPRRNATDSDVAILRALAESRTGAMRLSELSEETGYSERTIRRRVTGLKMNEEIREGGLLSDAEEGGVWFKSVEVAEEVGEYFAMKDTWQARDGLNER